MISIAESWLFATVVLAGLATGSLGLLLLGRLLGRDWVTPLDDELEPAGRTVPLVLAMAVPIALALGTLYPWGGPGWSASSGALAAWFQPAPFILRSLLYFAIWGAIAFVIVRSNSRVRNALGLVLLLPTVSLAGIDWVLGRPPFWWSSLFGFAFAASQLAPALALVFLGNAVQRERISRLHDRSLTSALITLALVIPWLWFVQFLAAWMGNLPAAAAWYEARLAGGRWIPLATAAAMLGLAILLLLQRHRGDITIIVAAGLIIVQHLLHMGWLLRPLGTPALNLADLAGILLLGGAWLLLWAILIRRHDARSAQPGFSGAS